MDATEVDSRPRSGRNSSMSEEEIAGVQAIFDENKKCENSFVKETRLPAKRARSNNRSGDDDDEGFTLVGKKPIRRAVRKSQPHVLKGTDKFNNNCFEVCVSSHKMLPKQIGLAMLLKAEGITNATKIKYKSPYRVVINFENKEDANNLVSSKAFMEAEYRCYLTSEVSVTYGVVKYLELDVKDEDLMESLQCEHKIVSVKRLKRMSEDGVWVSSETVRFGFKGSTLPPYVFGYGCRFKVDPYTFPVTQCASCWKYGHLTKQCPTKKSLCPKCGRGHANCETTEYRCINCKGEHMALSKSCPFYLKEREVRSIMCRENSTYKVALSSYIENKTRKFDEFFVSPPVFAFGNESNTKSYERVRPNMSYSQSVGAKATRRDASIHLDKTDFLQDNVEGEMSDEESKDSCEETLPSNNRKRSKNGKKKKNKKHEKVPSYPTEGSQGPSTAAPSGDKTQLGRDKKKKIDLSSIFSKAKDIVFSGKSFEEKISQVLKLLFDELVSFIKQMFSSGDVITKLLGLFYDG